MILRKLTTLLFLFIAFNLSAQNLYPNLFDQSGGIDNGYGAWGSNNYIREASFDVANKGTITFYHPDIAAVQKPTLFFISGWGEPYTTYDKYFKYVASLGYPVVNIYNFNPGSINTSYQNSLDMMQEAVNTYSQWIDTTKVGLAGHSYGAGSTIWLGKQVFDNNGLNWGTNGRFIMLFQPWLSFLVHDTDLQNYPENVKLLLLQSYDEVNYSGDTTYLTDPRAVRAMYQLISIPDEDKDCVTIFSDEDVAHQYSYNGNTFSYFADHYISYTDLVNGNRNPYDALDVFALNRLTNAMTDYVFEGNIAAKEVALGNGSTSQKDMGILPDLGVTDYFIETRPMSDFEYKCFESNPENTWSDSSIWFLSTYCDDADNDGHIDNIAASVSEENIENINVFPIPATSYISIDVNAKLGEKISLEIFDINGKTILKKQKISNNMLNISTLNSGTYYLKVTKEKQVFIKKIIKIKG